MDASSFVRIFNEPLASFPKIRELKDYILGIEYRLIEMKKVSTRYGLCIVIICRDHQGELFQTYLPSTYTNRYNDMDLQIVKTRPFWVTFRPNGQDSQLLMRFE